jgi:hypothetical protein
MNVTSRHPSGKRLFEAAHQRAIAANPPGRPRSNLRENCIVTFFTLFGQGKQVMGEPWFSVKTYGIGLSPKSPAGWIALAVYGAAVTAAPPVTAHFGAPRWVTGAAIAALTIGFLVLMFAKSDGRPWRWRWGGR